MRHSQIAYQTKKTFVKKLSLKSGKMTGLWQNDRLTLTFYMVSIPKWGTIIQISKEAFTPKNL